MRIGALYIAFGHNARTQANLSIKSLREHNQLPIAVISDRPIGIPGVIDIPFTDADPGGRLAKFRLPALSPFDQTLYLDADTRVNGDLSAGFRILESGWELVLAPSSRRGSDFMGHLSEEDRSLTVEAVGSDSILALQAGVMFIGKTPAIDKLFFQWSSEWTRFKKLDQGALLRALYRHPVKVWVLGFDWNSGSGALVTHLFGRARR